MNLLVDVPPDTVIIGGTEYDINSDFRASVLFEMLMQDEDIDASVKLERTLDIYFPNGYPDEDLTAIFNQIIWFYSCGRSEKERHRTRTTGTEPDDGTDDAPRNDEGYGHAQMAYSFDYDDEYIYAAFRQQYGINLTEIKYLHWWEFRALFKGLDHNCEFAKIMGYRTARITNDMSKSEKAFLRKMKSIHALPLSEKEQHANDALIKALRNGENIDELLGYE